jgi:hypothetical protein
MCVLRNEALDQLGLVERDFAPAWWAMANPCIEKMSRTQGKKNLGSRVPPAAFEIILAGPVIIHRGYAEAMR